MENNVYIILNNKIFKFQINNKIRLTYKGIIFKFDLIKNVVKIYERYKIQNLINYDWITNDCKIFRSKRGTKTSLEQDLYGKLVIETVKIINDEEFINSNSLEIIKFPTSLSNIGNGAFRECSSLTSLDFSDCTSLSTIGARAFNNCRNLQKCRLPKKLETIYGNSFGNYKSLYFYTDIDKNSDAYKTLLTICGSDDNRIRPSNQY